MRNSLSTKLTILLVGIYAALLVAGVMVYRSQSATMDQIMAVAEETQALTHEAQRPLALRQRQDALTKDIIIDVGRLDEATPAKLEAHDENRKVLAAIASTAQSAEVSRLIDQLNAIDDTKMRPLDEKILEALLVGGTAAAGKVYFGSYDAARKEYEQGIEDLRAVIEAQGKTEMNAAIEEGRSSRRRSAWMLAIGLFACGALLLWITRRITGDLNETAQVLAAVADGDLSGTLEIRSDDELGRMRGSLNRAIQGLRSTVHEMENAATALADEADELTDVSSSLSHEIGQTSELASEVASASVTIDQSIQSIANGVEELNISIGLISDNAAQAAGVASESQGRAEEARDLIGALMERAEKISAMVRVIDDIAERTDLLALNANIEAARSGEAGRGFAVVASEVKDLASHTANATSDIREQVITIERFTRQTTSSIGELNEVAMEVTELQGTIAAAVEEQRAMAADVSNILKQTAESITQITGNIGGVAVSASGVQEISGRVNVVAENTRRAATSLNTLIGTFRL